MTTTYTYDRNLIEGMTVYSPAFLATLATLHVGHWANLKLETDGLRYWLSRVSEEEPGGWQVLVEKSDGRGGWEELLSYKAKEAGA